MLAILLLGTAALASVDVPAHWVWAGPRVGSGLTNHAPDAPTLWNTTVGLDVGVGMGSWELAFGGGMRPVADRDVPGLEAVHAVEYGVAWVPPWPIAPRVSVGAVESRYWFADHHPNAVAGAFVEAGVRGRPLTWLQIDADVGGSADRLTFLPRYELQVALVAGF